MISTKRDAQKKNAKSISPFFSVRVTPVKYYGSENATPSLSRIKTDATPSLLRFFFAEILVGIEKRPIFAKKINVMEVTFYIKTQPSGAFGSSLIKTVGVVTDADDLSRITSDIRTNLALLAERFRAGKDAEGWASFTFKGIKMRLV